MAQKGNSQDQVDRRAFIGTGMVALATAGRTASAQSEKTSIGTDSKGRPLPYNPRIFEAMPRATLDKTAPV